MTKTKTCSSCKWWHRWHEAVEDQPRFCRCPDRKIEPPSPTLEIPEDDPFWLPADDQKWQDLTAGSGRIQFDKVEQKITHKDFSCDYHKETQKMQYNIDIKITYSVATYERALVVCETIALEIEEKASELFVKEPGFSVGVINGYRDFLTHTLYVRLVARADTLANAFAVGRICNEVIADYKETKVEASINPVIESDKEEIKDNGETLAL